MNNYLLFKNGRFHSRAQVLYDLTAEHLLDKSLTFAKDDRDGKLVYMDAAGAVIDRRANTATASGLTLSGIALPARIQIEGAWHDAISTSITLSFTYLGSYEIVVDPVSELPKTFTVTQP